MAGQAARNAAPEMGPPTADAGAKQEIALNMRMENTPQEKFPIASFSLVCLVIAITSIAVL